MLPKEARRIIEALARDINPETGELIMPEGDFHPSDVRWALLLASRVLATLERGATEGESGLNNAWEPWSVEEDKLLLELFDSQENIERMAQLHQRSKGAIAARLVRLGRIAERSEVYCRGN
jgi:hypothetical protein